MASLPKPPICLRFGVFELDLKRGELRKYGAPVSLQPQPFKILCALANQPGVLLSRQHLKHEVWNGDTFVDFDHGLNVCIRQIRAALSDDVSNPRFLQTVAKRGYRFIADVQPVREENAPQHVPAISILGWRWSLLLFASVGLIALAYALTVSKPSPLEVLDSLQLTNDGQMKTGPLLTDGSRVYFTELSSSGSSVKQVSIAGGESSPVSLPFREIQLLDISRNGTELLFLANPSANRQLWVLPLGGGAPRLLNPGPVGDATWGPTPRAVTYIQNKRLLIMSAGATAQPITEVPSASHLRWSPDGNVLRFDISTDSGLSSIWQISSTTPGSSSPQLKKVMSASCCGAWDAAQRHFVFQSHRGVRTDLWEVPERTHRFFGHTVPHQLTSGPMNLTDAVMSRDGHTLFAIGAVPRCELVQYDSKGATFKPFLSGLSVEGVDFSRDGKWLVWVTYPDGAMQRCKADGTACVQLTSAPMKVLLPRFSPDGQRVAFFGSLPDQSWRLYLISTNGGAAEPMLESAHSQADPNWSADGTSIVFGTMPWSDPDEPVVIKMINLRTRLVSVLPGSAGLFSPRWSPDGRYVAAIRFRDNVLMLFDTATRIWRPVTAFPVGYPSWSHDSRSIYFQDWTNAGPFAPTRILRLDLVSKQVETVARLSGLGRLPAGTISPWTGLAPDDSILFARDISSDEIYALRLKGY